MTRLNIIIKESNSEIEKRIRKCIEQELNIHINVRIASLKKEIEEGLKKSYLKDKTTDALIFGPLNAHFGFVAGRETFIVYKIIETIINNIEYEFKPFKVAGQKFNGHLTIKILKEGFADLLSLDVANTQNKQDLLPWLDWLLNKGNSIIIDDYKISFSVRTNFILSRSGQAVMLASPKGFWRVPSEHAGTPRKNWLTKVIIDNIKYIQDIIQEVIMKD